MTHLWFVRAVSVRKLLDSLRSIRSRLFGSVRVLSKAARQRRFVIYDKQVGSSGEIIKTKPIMKTITVDGVKYVSEADYKAKKGVAVESKKQIVILQRGWVFVGNYSINKEKDECTLTDASCIRVWGTEKGLGELAEKGPLQNTKIDPSPDVRFHPLTVVARMDVNEANWQ